MFIDRYIKIPVELEDLDNDDELGEPETYNSFKYVYPFDISVFGEHWDEGDEPENPSMTMITLKNGIDIPASIKLKDFIKLLNNYGKQ